MTTYLITPGPQGVIKDATNLVIPSPVTDGRTGSLLLAFKNDGSFSGSITIGAMPIGREDWASYWSPGGTTGTPFGPVLYRPIWLNGATPSTSTPYVSTAITTDSMILVPASGMAIVITPAATPTGSMSWFMVPVEGAAA